MNASAPCLALLASVILSSVSLAQEEMPKVVPMPELPGRLPQGANPATYPVGRFEWFQRVRENIDKGKAEADRCQLIFDGDSITANWLVYGKDIWDERYAKYNPMNFGIAGDAIENLLWRLDQGQAQGMHPRLIVLMIGTNKLPLYKPEQSVEGIEAAVASYRQICPDATILLMGILPKGEFSEEQFRPKIKKINEMLAAQDNGKDVFFLDIGSRMLEPDGSISKSTMSDFTHPTTKGYEIWAEAMQPIIDKVLNSSSN